MLYDRLLKNDLSSIIETLNTNSLHLWENKISNLDSLYNSFILLSSKSKKARSSENEFNINNAIKYAEKYALIPNPNYKSFNGI